MYLVFLRSTSNSHYSTHAGHHVGGAWIDSSYHLSYSNPDRALVFADKAIQLARQLDYPEGIVGAYGELGYAFQVKGNFERATNHFIEGIQLSRTIGDSLGLVCIINNLGNTYRDQNEYQQAL